MKNKKINYKKELIFNSVISTILFITSVAYGFMIVFLMKQLLYIPSEDFTPKLVFIGIVLLYILYKVCLFCLSMASESMKDAKEAYDKIGKEDK